MASFFISLLLLSGHVGILDNCLVQHNFYWECILIFQTSLPMFVHLRGVLSTKIKGQHYPSM